jgi:hypothetical protein
MTTGRTAIAKWRSLHRPPDKHAEGVLRRLTSDRRAAKAFTLNPAQYTAIVIVGDCVKAEMISRTFAERLQAERKMATLIDIADMGLRACRTIAMEIARPAAGVTSRLYDNGPRIEAALEELQGLIERRRMIVRVTPTRLGTTRKQHDPEAGVRAAIGWLAESVQRVTGRPYCAAVAQGWSGKCRETNPAKGYGMAVGGVAVA